MDPRKWNGMIRSIGDIVSFGKRQSRKIGDHRGKAANPERSRSKKETRYLTARPGAENLVRG